MAAMCRQPADERAEGATPDEPRAAVRSIAFRRSLMGPRHPSMIILWASIYHLFWGAVLLAGVTPFFTAAAALRFVLPNPYVRGVFLVFAALSALWGQYRLQPRQAIARLMSAIPQQFILFLSGGSALSAIIHQRYPDGTGRPWSFILVDQMPLLLGMLMYTVVILWPALALAWGKE